MFRNADLGKVRDELARIIRAGTFSAHLGAAAFTRPFAAEIAKRARAEAAATRLAAVMPPHRLHIALAEAKRRADLFRTISNETGTYCGAPETAGLESVYADAARGFLG